MKMLQCETRDKDGRRAWIDLYPVTKTVGNVAQHLKFCALSLPSDTLRIIEILAEQKKS